MTYLEYEVIAAMGSCSKSRLDGNDEMEASVEKFELSYIEDETEENSVRDIVAVGTEDLGWWWR